MTKEEKTAYLKERGWGQWYHEDCWVHPKLVAKPEMQDYTNYALPLDDAYRFESEAMPPFEPIIYYILGGEHPLYSGKPGPQ